MLLSYPFCNPISGVSYVISPDIEKETLTWITFKMSFSLNQEERFFFFSLMNHKLEGYKRCECELGKGFHSLFQVVQRFKAIICHSTLGFFYWTVIHFCLILWSKIQEAFIAGGDFWNQALHLGENFRSKPRKIWFVQDLTAGSPWFELITLVLSPKFISFYSLLSLGVTKNEELIRLSGQWKFCCSFSCIRYL